MTNFFVTELSMNKSIKQWQRSKKKFAFAQSKWTLIMQIREISNCFIEVHLIQVNSPIADAVHS